MQAFKQFAKKILHVKTEIVAFVERKIKQQKVFIFFLSSILNIHTAYPQFFVTK